MTKLTAKQKFYAAAVVAAVVITVVLILKYADDSAESDESPSAESDESSVIESDEPPVVPNEYTESNDDLAAPILGDVNLDNNTILPPSRPNATITPINSGKKSMKRERKRAGKKAGKKTGKSAVIMPGPAIVESDIVESDIVANQGVVLEEIKQNINEIDKEEEDNTNSIQDESDVIVGISDKIDELKIDESKGDTSNKDIRTELEKELKQALKRVAKLEDKNRALRVTKRKNMDTMRAIKTQVNSNILIKDAMTAPPPNLPSSLETPNTRCEYAEWIPSGNCSEVCGHGIQQFNRVLKSGPTQTCTELTKEERCNNRRCGNFEFVGDVIYSKNSISSTITFVLRPNTDISKIQIEGLLAQRNSESDSVRNTDLIQLGVLSNIYDTESETNPAGNFTIQNTAGNIQLSFIYNLNDEQSRFAKKGNSELLLKLYVGNSLKDSKQEMIIGNPRNCVVSEWSDWLRGDNKKCNSVEIRTRQVNKKPLFGGEACPALKETRPYGPTCKEKKANKSQTKQKKEKYRENMTNMTRHEQDMYWAKWSPNPEAAMAAVQKKFEDNPFMKNRQQLPPIPLEDKPTNYCGYTKWTNWKTENFQGIGCKVKTRKRCLKPGHNDTTCRSFVEMRPDEYCDMNKIKQVQDNIKKRIEDGGC